MRNNNLNKLGSLTNLADYLAREEHKTIGWRKYFESKDVNTRAEGLNMIIEAHFARSILSSRRKHPELGIYAQHWLKANGSRYDNAVVMSLTEKYGSITGDIMITPGFSYWNTNNQRYARYRQRQLSQ